MKILVINSGSSSIKYKLIDMDGEAARAEGVLEKIGEPDARITHKARPGSGPPHKKAINARIPDHTRGMERIVALLTDDEFGVIEDRSAISAIGHRVVQGGTGFNEPALITEAVIDGIRANIPLAPLHNPGALSGITTALELFPDISQVAVFDTAFHQSIPETAFRYAVPQWVYREAGVRRFGFHGTSHCYVTHEAAQQLGKPAEDTNLISLHLGNGSSITAVRGGRSADTSMGMTPLEGVIMGTRSGSIDPAVIDHLVTHQGMPLEEVMGILTRESGLKGLCGSNDLRDIHDMAASGDTNAQLALDMLVYSCRKYVGAYMAVLGRVDGLVFTAGIGENDPAVRLGICENLEPLGICIDPVLNADPSAGGGTISTPQSRVKVMVIPTNEELEIARQVVKLQSS